MMAGVTAAKNTSQTISYVIPVYNESSGIEVFHETMLLREINKITNYSYEIIYVNDGSDDNSLDKLQRIADSDPQVKVVGLSRNFGKEIAITAGIFQASGDAIMLLDADGQHPPKYFPKFISQWENGAQVVVGVRQSNLQEGLIKKWGSKLFYKLFNNLSGTTMVPRSTDFRLLDRAVQIEFMKCHERSRITRGLIDSLGFKKEYIEFSSPARLAGEASYSTSKLIGLAMNSFVSLSLKPLLLLVWGGFLVTVFSMVLGLFIVVEQYILDDPLGLDITGGALLVVLVTFLVGIILIGQGIIAIYVSHIYEQTQGRPLFIINSSSSRNLK